jgi:hypothetical protein
LLIYFLGTYQALPVTVTSSGGGYPNVVARQIILTMAYYQINQGYKRMVYSNIAFDPSSQCHTITSMNAERSTYEAQGINQCILSITGQVAQSNYQLEIQLNPLVWLDLLNAFAFTVDVYIIFFIVVGMFAMLVSGLIWVINRLLTRLRHPPAFHYTVLLYTIAQPALIGTFLGCFPTFLGIIMCYNWFMPASLGGSVCTLDDTVIPAGTIQLISLQYFLCLYFMSYFCLYSVETPSSLCLEAILDWGEAYSTDQMRLGRKGTCMLAICSYVTFLSCKLLIPKWDEEDRSILKKLIMNEGGKSKTVVAKDKDDDLPPSDIWAPEIWRRSNIILFSMFIIGMLTVQMEFSYSPMFSNFVYQFILGFKVFYVVMEETVFYPTLKECVFVAPFVIAYVLVSNMTTMGASNFVQFLVSYFAGLFLTLFERLYSSPMIGIVLCNIPKWKMMFVRRFRGNKRMTREEKAKEELEWRKINEEIELHEEGIEPMLDSYIDYTLDTASCIISPVLYQWLSLFYQESQIAALYAIKENQTIIYVSFAAVIVPFTFLTDVLIHNTLELVHGWKIYDYVSYQRYRFTVREHRWLMRNEIFDESIGEEMQTIDMLCFSSQYYFLVSQFGFAVCIGVMSMEIFLRQNFNLFADPATPLIFVIIFTLGELLALVTWLMCDLKIKRFGWRGLWMTKQVEGTVDDDVAAKLAIGEGRQQDLEQERLELQALNSDRFRHRFLERNRPWILQHLVDLITPRQLDQRGPDDRPVIEYVRDVYSELMSIGEGLRKAGDRDDVSSDGMEDELEAARRNWSRQPLAGVSLAIARMWLAKARKRRAFSVLIRGIIDQRKKPNCEICGRNPERNNVRLVCHLATDSAPDVRAIDRLIAMFENQYGVNELDPQLWKAFFRSQAEFATRCTICQDSVAQDRMNKQGRAPGADIPTRPGDISSDEEDDDVIFEPIIVTRTSPEGRMMSKWLLSARKKLGGRFPRTEAKQQMDRYAQKLRNLKMKKAKAAAKKAAKADLDGPAAETEDGLLKDAADAQFNAATKALALRWIRMARDSLESKFRSKSENLKDEINVLLASMPLEDDWYFGAAMRLEGGALLKRAADLDDDRRVMEAEAAVKIHKIEADLKAYVETRKDEVQIERATFEGKIAQINDRVNLDIEIRTAELERLKASKEVEFKEIEKKAKMELGAAPTEMTQSHRSQLIDLDNLIESERSTAERNRDANEKESRIMFETQENVKIGDMNRRTTIAGDNIARIRQDVSDKVRKTETVWQVDSVKWTSIARKKVQVKKQEDSDASKSKRVRKGL